MISRPLTARAQLRLPFALGVVAFLLLNASSAGNAQGLVQGVQQGAQAGNKAAGPVGGVLGGVAYRWISSEPSAQIVGDRVGAAA